MRTKTLLLIAATAVAGIVASHAQGAVYSVNAVGYVNKSLVKGFNLISNPLNGQTNTVTGLLSGQVPQDTQIFLWDNVAKGFKTGAYDTQFGWDDAVANAPLVPGGGFFLKLPVAQTVTFVGEVPQGTSPALSTALVPGLQIVSSQVPQAGKLTTDLSYAGAQDDKVFQWDPTKAGYNQFTFDTTFGWDPAEPQLDVGEAIFLSRTAAGTWTRNFSVNQ